MTSGNDLPRLRRILEAGHPGRLRLALVGDSISEITDKWYGGASRPENNWGAVLARLLERAHAGLSVDLRNFGIGGQNTYEGLGRIHELEPFKPDLVLLAFGANDCAYHFLIPEETYLALANMIHTVRSRFGADVVAVGTAGDNPLKPFFRHLDQTLAAQRRAARQRGAPFTDVRAAILEATENGMKWAAYHLDEKNCHPNDNGHAVWARAVFDTIHRSLARP